MSAKKIVLYFAYLIILLNTFFFFYYEEGYNSSLSYAGTNAGMACLIAIVMVSIYRERVTEKYTSLEILFILTVLVLEAISGILLFLGKVTTLSFAISSMMIPFALAYYFYERNRMKKSWPDKNNQSHQLSKK